MGYAIGIDLGGTSIKLVVVTPIGETLRQTQIKFDSSKRMDWAEKIRATVRGLVREWGTADAMGVSAPGLAARKGEAILHMPERLDGLVGLNWTRYLESERPAPVLNDAHAALLGESWLGAAKGFKDVFMVTLGTGVGGAALVDGRLLCGRTGKGGHLGHVCLNPDKPPGITGMPGSLEDAIGNCTVRQRTNGRFQSTHDLVAAHQSADADATKIWLDSVRHLACAIGSFINILDPAAAIIGGGIAKAGSALFDPLREFVQKVEWCPTGEHVQILPAQLGEYAGAYGAAFNALHP